jgi:dipeptidyl aminopeptidase/acylaminoacyl peptidase
VAGLFRVSAQGSVPALVARAPRQAVTGSRLTWLADGQRLLLTAPSAEGVRMWVTSPGPGEFTELPSPAATGPVLHSQGHLVFARETLLMAQPFDSRDLAPQGEAFVIAEAVDPPRNRLAERTRPQIGDFSVSDTGVLAYVTEFSRGSPQLVWFDRSGGGRTPIGDRAEYGHIEMSPDGRRAAVSVMDPVTRNRDLWTIDLARGVRTRLTFDSADDDSPVWSPDGRRVVFRSGRSVRRGLYQKASDGTGGETELLVDGHTNTPLSWSRDGKYLLFASDARGAGLWVLPLSGGKKPVPLHETPFRETDGQFSPNGDWVAYVSNESGRDEVYVAPFLGPGGRVQISRAGGRQPRWRRDGREVFYLAPDNRLRAVTVSLSRSRIEAGTAQAVLDLSPAGAGMSYAASADGQRFLVNTVEAPPAPTIAAVINWPGSRK